MNLEITGKLVEKYDTHVVNERFKKREFVLELVEDVNGSPYTNYAKMQLVQNKCDILDRFQIGDTLKVNFNIKGNRYEKDGRTSYFSNLDAWRLDKIDPNAPQGSGYQQQNNPYQQSAPNTGYQGNSGGNWGGNQGYQSQTAVQNSNTEQADDLPF